MVYLSTPFVPNCKGVAPTVWKAVYEFVLNKLALLVPSCVFCPKILTPSVIFCCTSVPVNVALVPVNVPVKVGLAENTAEPVPVSSVKEVAN